MRGKIKKHATKIDPKENLKKKPTRANRNTAEAELEENSLPYDEIGKTDEEIRQEDQVENEKGPNLSSGPLPTQGSY